MAQRDLICFIEPTAECSTSGPKTASAFNLGYDCICERN